jgi:hypothetical protein
MAQPQWITSASLGTYPSGITTSIQLTATAVSPSDSIKYAILNGAMPVGLSLAVTGLISGIPDAVSQATTYQFTVRATDNLFNLRDRTFTLIMSGVAIPRFSTPSGLLSTITDSVWTDITLAYTNPSPTNVVATQLIAGVLPTGLEINTSGVIRGYADAPYSTTSASGFSIPAYTTESVTNSVSCYTTGNFVVGRPITFSYGDPIPAGSFSVGYTYTIIVIGNTDWISIGAASATIGTSFVTTASGSGTGYAYKSFGGIVVGQTYYVKDILTTRAFTISSTQFGDIFPLTYSTDSITATLPTVTSTTPTTRTSTFALKLISKLGGDDEVFSIAVENQQLSNSANTRPPVILNTRPQTFIIKPTDKYAGYYILTPGAGDNTAVAAYIGVIKSGSYWTFKIIGHDFDGGPVGYSFNNLATGYVGNTATGWITGTVTVTPRTTLSNTFTVFAYKLITLFDATAIFAGQQYIIVTVGTTDWRLLGAASNSIGTIFTANAAGTALSGTGFAYEIISSDTFTFSLLVSEITDLTVTWNTPANLGSAYNSSISMLQVSATAQVALEYTLISGTLPPGLTLNSNGEIVGRISNEVLSTVTTVTSVTSPPSNIFTFTIKAASPIYTTIMSSRTFTVSIVQEFTQPTDILYIKAAPSVADRHVIESLLTDPLIIPTDDLYRATDPNFGKATAVIYEHCYGIRSSDVQEYLAAIAIKNHYWRNITLGQIKTAQARDSKNNIIYEVVYSEVIDDLNNPSGVSIPKEIYWETPINLNLGPYYTSLTDIFTSSTVWYTSFTPGFASMLYPNSLYNMRNQVAEVLGQDLANNLLPLWMTSGQGTGGSLGYTPAWVICYTKPGKSATIASNIQNNWPHTLNEINFKIDRFLVNKFGTWDYDNLLTPASWLDLPSGIPTPSPRDSKDLPILFPRTSILPTKPNYPG